jgi:DNA-binding transcriptional LysR family regulator
VRVELELSDRLVAMAQEGFDVALRHTAAPPDTHVAWPLCTTRSWLVASRAYLRRAGMPATPADLATHDCLHYLRPGETPTWSFEADPAAPRSTKGLGRVSVGVRGIFAANNSEALREAALAGLGIALLPDFSAQAALQAGKLQVVLPHWKPVGAFGEHLYAIRPYSPVVPRAVQAFIGYWRSALEGGFPIDAPARASRAR